ncbi:MAG: 2-hydroxychromene-2-carboxylate isomerase [Pseudomonadota bacterium]
MHTITFSLDFVSPYAYLAFAQLPQALEGCSYIVRHRPVLLGALMQHHGHQGPAGIPPKHAWVLRQTRWLAHAHGIPFQLPAVHPFNPLPLLRLSLACADGEGFINRHVADTLFRHVWQSGGADAGDAARLAALAATLSLQRDPAGPEVKAMLRAHTDAAVAEQLFGVPAFAVDGQQFWGFDALPMLRACLAGDPWFADQG